MSITDDNRLLLNESAEMRAAATWLAQYLPKHARSQRIAMTERALGRMPVRDNRKRAALKHVLEKLRLPSGKPFGVWHRRHEPGISFALLNAEPVALYNTLTEALMEDVEETLPPAMPEVEQDAEDEAIDAVLLGHEPDDPEQCDDERPAAEQLTFDVEQPKPAHLHVGAITVGEALAACLDRMESTREPLTVSDARKVTDIARRAIGLAWGFPPDAITVKLPELTA